MSARWATLDVNGFRSLELPLLCTLEPIWLPLDSKFLSSTKMAAHNLPDFSLFSQFFSCIITWKHIQKCFETYHEACYQQSTVTNLSTYNLMISLSFLLIKNHTWLNLDIYVQICLSLSIQGPVLWTKRNNAV